MSPRGDTEAKKQELGEWTKGNSEVGRSRESKPGSEVTLELLPENWTNSANQKRVQGVDAETADGSGMTKAPPALHPGAGCFPPVAMPGVRPPGFCTPKGGLLQQEGKAAKCGFLLPSCGLERLPGPD